jgi:Uma2 family endonuclease
MASTISIPTSGRDEPQLPPLVNGDHLDQPTYHARYLAMPEAFRAELIGGIVFTASRVGARHARMTPVTTYWLLKYETGTPGVEALGRGTVIVGPRDEPEPDALLRIRPDFGGRTRDEDDFVHGAPELVVEVALSTESTDLHLKRHRYEAAGIDEYLVVVLYPAEVRWLVLEDHRYREMAPDPDGILRSRRFAGLWLNPRALLARDVPSLEATLQAGLDSPEHQEWVAALRSRGVP